MAEHALCPFKMEQILLIRHQLQPRGKVYSSVFTSYILPLTSIDFFPFISKIKFY